MSTRLIGRGAVEGRGGVSAGPATCSREDRGNLGAQIWHPRPRDGGGERARTSPSRRSRTGDPSCDDSNTDRRETNRANAAKLLPCSWSDPSADGWLLLRHAEPLVCLARRLSRRPAAAQSANGQNSRLALKLKCHGQARPIVSDRESWLSVGTFSKSRRRKSGRIVWESSLDDDARACALSGKIV